MLDSQKFEMRKSEIRQRLGEIAKIEGDKYTDEIKAEESGLLDELPALEQRFRAAMLAEAADDQADKAKGDDDSPDAERRERLELRSKCSVGRYLVAALRGRQPDGAEAELAAAAGVTGIPLELFEPSPEEREKAEKRTVTAAPGSHTTVNMDTLQPAIFARSVTGRLGIDMPMVDQGTYSTGTITTPVTADARTRGADAPQTAGVFTMQSAVPKRISASLKLGIEDIALTGGNFESVLRENLMLAMSDKLDTFALTGDGISPNPEGILTAITAPTAGGTVIDFDGFAALHADAIDGLFAEDIMQVLILAGVDTYKLAAKTFQREETGSKGEMSAAAYAMAHTGGLITSKRMPAVASKAQDALIYRMGRMVRTAVCPHWGSLNIDDVYTGSLKGERQFSMHVLLGDVLIVQPGAYARIKPKIVA